MYADAMTKRHGSTPLLQTFMKTGRICITEESAILEKHRVDPKSKNSSSKTWDDPAAANLVGVQWPNDLGRESLNEPPRAKDTVAAVKPRKTPRRPRHKRGKTADAVLDVVEPRRELLNKPPRSKDPAEPRRETLNVPPQPQ